MLELDFIRHAESEANTAPGICSGQSNHVSLTERGVRQAKALQRRFLSEGVVFDKILRSTAVRTDLTAKYALGNQFAYAAHTKHDALLEIHQGDFTGRLKTEVYTPEALASIAIDPWEFRPPNGESQSDVAKRMWEETQVLINAYHASGDKPTRVAIVTHGLSIKAWMRQLLQFDKQLTWLIEIDNTSITQFNYGKVHGKYVWMLKRINDAAHIVGI